MPKRILFIVLALACLHPSVPAVAALLGGIAFALILGQPFGQGLKKWTHTLLEFSVIGLGGGINLVAVGAVGLHGFFYTLISIAFTLGLGLWIGRRLQVGSRVAMLIACGTAICGGSAIAAVAPVIEAQSAEISVALVTVFLLNAVALLVFPPLGHAFHLDQNQFGLFAALAIHDTSSVVGAALQYGARALEIATTVKLARALWIVPLAAGLGFFGAGRKSFGSIRKPWFILGFVVVAALVTWVPALREPGAWLAAGAKRTLVLTLFLIGGGLNRQALREVGPRPFAMGLGLWVLVTCATLGAILMGVLR